MVRIGIFCFAGMSTSILVKKMTNYALEKGLECQVNAYSQTEVASRAPNLDVVVLGPQIKHYKKRIEAICESIGVPVMVISNTDFGRMDGVNVLTQVYSLIGESI